MFPVEDSDNRLRLKEILNVYLHDNVKARELQPDGTWVRRAPVGDELPLNAQESFLSAIRAADAVVDTTPRPKRSSKRGTKMPGEAG